MVVDLSLGFTDPTVPTGSDLDRVVASTAQLIEIGRGAACPIIFTTIVFGPEHANAAWLRKAPGLAALHPGSRLVDIDPRLEPAPDDPVIVKQGASAFFGTGLAASLRSLGVDTVVVCGATTSGCVRATAVDSVQFGFPTIVPRECVGDRARGPHDASLFDLQAKYADVVGVRDVAEHLRSTRGWVLR